MKRKMKILLLSLLVTVSLGTFPAAVWADGTSSSPVIETKSSGDPYEDNGVQYSMKYAAGGTESANVISKSAAVNLLDLKNPADITVKGDIANTTGEAKEVSIIFQLPNLFKGSDTYSPSLKAMPEITGDLDGIEVVYEVVYEVAGKGGRYKKADEDPINGDPSKIDAVWVRGTLKAGGSVHVDAALKTISKETGKTKVKGGVYIYKPTQFIRSFDALTTSDLEYPVSYTMGRKVFATLVQNEQGVDTMDLAPDEVQAVMPVASTDWIKFSRWGIPGMDDPSDENIYTNSSYIVKTQPIFDAIKDMGYATRFDDKGFWEKYTYSYWSKSKKPLTGTDGKPVQVDNPYKNEVSNLLSHYASVFRILETKDLKLEVGDAWSLYDNLVSAKDCTLNDIPQDNAHVR